MSTNQTNFGRSSPSRVDAGTTSCRQLTAVAAIDVTDDTPLQLLRSGSHIDLEKADETWRGRDSGG
jgi:hypothetical protein